MCACVCVHACVCGCLCMHSIQPNPMCCPYTKTSGTCLLLNPHQNKFREGLVERVKWNVNRDSPEDKLRDFMDWMKAIKKETLHHVCMCVCVCVGGVW